MVDKWWISAGFFQMKNKRKLCNKIIFFWQFAMMECVISGLSDEYPRYLRKYKEIFVLVMCCIAFLLGIPNVTQVGFSYNLLISVCTCERDVFRILSNT